MFEIPDPKLQIDFSKSLVEIRGEYLQDALAATISKLDVTELDKALAKVVPKPSLAMLASHGLRGELAFPVPMVLSENPRLLGYYRLLYGYSKKAFYTKKTGGSSFESMETSGKLPKGGTADLNDLCCALAAAGAILMEHIGVEQRVSRCLFHDLTLLTLGAQLRGGANVKKGAEEITKVFKVIREIVEHDVREVEASETRSINITNAAGRLTYIDLAPDPDITIREKMDNGNFRPIVAIEVKGGSDFSNIHNRIGEAEKSHQKAKYAGYDQCWTIVNVDDFNRGTARKESPATNRFYKISDLVKRHGHEYDDFRNQIISLVGIRSS